MKTAISIPDEVFESAERLAEEAGISRSELYVTALRSYIEEQQGLKVMEKLNKIYGKEKSKLDPVLKKLQSKVMRREKW